MYAQDFLLLCITTNGAHEYYTSEERLRGAETRIGNDPQRDNPYCSDTVNSYTNPQPVSCNLEGRYISIHLPSTRAEYLTICEVRAFKGNCAAGKNNLHFCCQDCILFFFI